MFNRSHFLLCAMLILSLLQSLSLHAADAAAQLTSPPLPVGPHGQQENEDKRTVQERRIFYANAKSIVVGTLTDVRVTNIAKSNPPIYSFKLVVTPTEVFRGGHTVGQPLTLGYSARFVPSVLRQKKPVLVTAAMVGGNFRAKSIEPATKANVILARYSGLPLGWTHNEQQATSPWAALGKDAFPHADMPPAAVKGLPLRCAVTGRPAWRVGDEIRISAEPVPPTDPTIGTNTDGPFKITLTNRTDKPVFVPALLHDASKTHKPILWSHSLLVLCQDKGHVLPDTKPLTDKVKPRGTTLEPGASISTVINVLGLKKVDWPREEGRVYFKFALGEHSADARMYYRSNYHDKHRKAANAGK